MLDFLYKLILTNKLQFRKGEIILLGSYVTLIPPTVYVALLKELEKENKQNLIYDYNKKAAFKWLSQLVKENKSPEDLLEFTLKLINLLALGETSLLEKDLKNNNFKFELKNSLTAEIYGKSNNPIDLEFSGLMAGALSYIFNKDFVCSEESCVANGAKSCIFVARVVN